MGERFPDFNSESVHEPSSEDRAVDFLKIEGSEAPRLLAWIEQERKKLKEENPAEAEARLGAKLARIYYKAGYTGDGLERMQDVRTDASKINGEFFKEVEETIERMKRGETL